MKQSTTFLTLLYLQLKRELHKFPYLLIGMLILCSMIGGFSFLAMNSYAHSVEKGLRTDTLNVDLVVHDKSAETSFALRYIQNMESTKDVLSFHITSEMQAYQDLNAHQAVAVIILPDGTLESILNGTNQSVRILFPDSTSSLSHLILRELANSGAVLLDTAQAGIYTITDLYIEHNLQNYLQTGYDALNQMNLSYALSRDQIFTPKSANALGSYTTVSYYTGSAICLFLLLSGILYSSFLEKETTGFHALMIQHRISTLSYVISQWITVFLFSLIFSAVIPLIGAFLIPDMQMNWCSLLLLLAFESSFICMIYAIAPNSSTGILLLTVSTFLLLFLSGAFIPTVFFPICIQRLSTVMPTTYFFRQAIQLFVSYDDTSNLFPLGIYIFLFITLSVIALSLQRRKEFS